MNRRDFFTSYKQINRNKKEVSLTVDVMENRKLFFLLTSLLSSLSTAQTLEDALDAFYRVGGSSDLVKKLFIYLKLPKSMLRNLTSSNVSIAGEELVLLKNYIFEIMGDGSIYKFVNNAIDNPPKTKILDIFDTDDSSGITYDTYDMDWSFYSSEADCKAQKNKKVGHFPKVCHKGTKGGEDVFWLYPTDFKGNNGGMSGKNHTSLSSYTTKPFKKNSKTAKKDGQKEVQEKKKADKQDGGKKDSSPKLKTPPVQKSLFEQIGV